ncbi:SGNH/GDSL hydrolase family protein [Skermania piniformis]|uniref:SGNH/GDSL hydrolase family protein n=1 Tax=Skermania pinensis TaxID=39122 RepID=A0ABX8SCS4_9ACTN|nr:SGNH/GDSL hydrolase family protein [Skermania piniformis]QXQ15221.1 SGNH/GDSL hydrolase family protein [Skermania piniformis]
MTDSPARRSAVVIAALAVLVGVAAGAAVVRQYSLTRPDAAAAPTAPVVPAVPPPAPSILFIGDTYTLGPPSLPDLGYACRTAATLDMDCSLAAVPGSGFINGGPQHRLPQTDIVSSSFAERVPELQARHQPDVVVLDGGRNDLPYGLDNLRNAVLYTLELTVQAWPQARVVLIAPWFLADPTPVGVVDRTRTPVGQVLQAAVAADPPLHAVDVVDPGPAGWFTGTATRDLLADDGVEPSVDGHDWIAGRLVAELRARGIGGSR